MTSNSICKMLHLGDQNVIQYLPPKMVQPIYYSDFKLVIVSNDAINLMKSVPH